MAKKTCCSIIIIFILLILCVGIYLFAKIPHAWNKPLMKTTTTTSIELSTEYKKMFLSDEELINYEKQYRKRFLESCLNANNDFNTLFVAANEFVTRNPNVRNLSLSETIESFQSQPFTWNPIYYVSCNGNTKEREIESQFTKFMSNSKFLSMFKFDENKRKEILKIHKAYLEIPRNDNSWSTEKISNLCPILTELVYFKYNTGIMNRNYVESSCELTMKMLDDDRGKYFVDYYIVSIVADILKRIEPALSTSDIKKKRDECQSNTLAPSQIFMFSYLEKHQLEKYDKKISDFFKTAVNSAEALENNLKPEISEKMKNLILIKPWLRGICDYNAYDFVKYYHFEKNFLTEINMIDQYKSNTGCHGSCSKVNFFTTLSYFDNEQSIYLSPYFMKKNGILEGNEFTSNQIVSLSYVLGDELCKALDKYRKDYFSKQDEKKDPEYEECRKKLLAKRLLEHYKFNISDEQFEKIFNETEGLVKETKDSMT